MPDYHTGRPCALTSKEHLAVLAIQPAPENSTVRAPNADHSLCMWPARHARHNVFRLHQRRHGTRCQTRKHTICMGQPDWARAHACAMTSHAHRRTQRCCCTCTRPIVRNVQPPQCEWQWGQNPVAIDWWTYVARHDMDWVYAKTTNEWMIEKQ